MVKFFPPNIWQMMIFLNPLGALIPKIPFSFFCRFLGLGHLRGPGVSLVRIFWVPSIEPRFGGGGLARGLYRHPPTPPIDSPSTPASSPHPQSSTPDPHHITSHPHCIFMASSASLPTSSPHQQPSSLQGQYIMNHPRHTSSPHPHPTLTTSSPHQQLPSPYPCPPILTAA